MTSNSVESLRRSIVLVTSTDPSNKYWGTAFIVHHDANHTYLLTCAHVVDDVGGKERVKIADCQAEVTDYRADLDAAVLKIKQIPEFPVIPLCVKKRATGNFSTYGFLKGKPDYLLESLRGTFGRVKPLYTSDKLNGHIAWELSPEDKASFQPGQSGSPVFSDAGECIAMVTLKDGNSGVARSIELIREVLPVIVLNDGAMRLSAIGKRDRSPRMNREDEIDAFVRIMSNEDTNTKVVVIDGEPGMGKSRLLLEYEDIAERYDWAIERKNFKEQINVDSFLTSIERRFGGRAKFPEYYRFKGQPRAPNNPEEYLRLLANNFCNDLAKLDYVAPVLLIIDEYHLADDQLKALCDHFLQEIATGLPLIAVVAGQRVPRLPYSENENWLRRFTLNRLTFECWTAHVQKQGLQVPVEELQATYEDASGIPLGLVVSNRRFLRERTSA